MGISLFPLEWTSQYAWLTLQWTLMNFSTYIKNGCTLLIRESPYTYTDKPSDAHVRRQDNGHEGQSSIYIYIKYIFLLVSNNSELPTAFIVPLKSQVLYWIQKFSYAEQGKGVKKSNTFWIGPKYPRLIFWESCSA